MRKKSASEEHIPKPQTRRVILIKDNSQHPQPLNLSQRGFIPHIEPQADQNTNSMNRQPPLPSVNNEKSLSSSFLPIPQRTIQNHLVHGQIDMLVSSLLQLSQEVSTLITRMDILESKFTKIEEKANNHLVPSRKKLRRRADEINKDFMCTEERCGKAYGSEVSLNLHLRLKHPHRARQSLALKGKEREKEKEKIQKNVRYGPNEEPSESQNEEIEE